MPNRSVRAVLTFLNDLLSQVAATFVSLVITPLIVVSLGTDVFGAWKVIGRTTEFLTLGNFKPLGLLRLILAKDIGNNDFAYKQQQLGAAISVLVLTLPILFVLSFLLFYFRDVFIPVPKGISHQVELALLVMMFVVVIEPFLHITSTVVSGLNMQYKLLGVHGTVTVITALLTYDILIQGYKLQWIAAISSLPIITTALVNYAIIVKNVPWFKFVRPPTQLIRSFFKINAWALLANFFRYVFESADLILIGVYFGVGTTAIYSLTKSLITFLLMPANSLMQSGLAGVGDLIGRKELKSVMRLRSEQINALVFASFIIGVIVMFFNASFVGIWVDEKHFGGETLSRWIIVATIINILAKTEANYIDAALELKTQALSLGLAVISYLAIIALCEPFWGLNVFPIAQVFSQFILIALYWVGLKKLLQGKLSAIIRTVLRPFLVAGILLYGCSFLSIDKVDNWFDLIIHASKIGVIAMYLSWRLVLQKNDRKRLTMRLLKILGK